MLRSSMYQIKKKVVARPKGLRPSGLRPFTRLPSASKKRKSERAKRESSSLFAWRRQVGGPFSHLTVNFIKKPPKGCKRLHLRGILQLIVSKVVVKMQLSLIFTVKRACHYSQMQVSLVLFACQNAINFYYQVLWGWFNVRLVGDLSVIIMILQVKACYFMSNAAKMPVIHDISLSVLKIELEV